MKFLYTLFLFISLGFGTWASSEKSDGIEITIENTNAFLERKDEVIELDWNALAKNNSSVLSYSFVVEDQHTGKQLPYQVIQDEAQKPVLLLIQASIASNSSIKVIIKKGIPKAFKTKTFGRMVPERKDDFAWENDKIAFRMYGPALEATGEISNGIDVWLKRTPELIIDKWYKLDDYHVDHGEGLDCYKVGPTLGAGGIAPTTNGKLFYSKNWSAYKVLTTGCLRTVFELSYNKWQFDGSEITETKRITLNAGSQLNQIEVTYKSKDLDTIPVAMGIVKRSGKGVAVLNEKSGYISYWEPTNTQYGTTAIGLIVPESSGMTVLENHFTALGKAINNKPFRYYQGACWEKAGEFKNDQSWEKYLKEFTLKLKTPLKISINQ
jgi:hypothetical protein